MKSCINCKNYKVCELERNAMIDSHNIEGMTSTDYLLRYIWPKLPKQCGEYKKNGR